MNMNLQNNNCALDKEARIKEQKRKQKKTTIIALVGLFVLWLLGYGILSIVVYAPKDDSAEIYKEKLSQLEGFTEKYGTISELEMLSDKPILTQENPHRYCYDLNVTTDKGNYIIRLYYRTIDKKLIYDYEVITEQAPPSGMFEDVVN